ncbi:MAG: glycosyltransferase family 4 protein [Alphaproteobacteria bacterium]|nr:glycosyltransferase family 4 protein [Alphaproteobacteria bacterium]MBP7757989.1 glycosyltransferase family 4 protein [Alphaproteobacteria bacterium]MBP7761316.1 glycosyltransferase family 4 protein [Alphaproteobacteria bacterium]MBP7905707.1 glycosyltransferase family 4 protein [Alphaproteobacteria bacterium]
MSATPFEPVIMQIVPELGAGGAEQGCIDIAAELVRAGAKSIVVSNGGFRIPELLRTGALHINLPVHSKNPVIMWRNIARLQKLIRQHKVNIVHARSRAPAWSAYKACKNTEAHFITTCHAPYNISGEAKRLYNRSIAQGELVIAISDYVADYLRKNYDLDTGKIRVIPRGIPIERFHPTAVTPERLITLSRELRIPEGSNIIMMPGRLTRWKGHHVLIDAIEKLDRQDIFCVMIGSDQGRSEYRKELEEAITKKDLGSKIRIVDHCNDMPAAYMLSTVVVSASTDPEGFGRVPVEAQAMGRPIVATDHGGAQETIVRGQTGWLVPPNDAPALAKAIEEALSLNPMQRAVLATRSMSHVAAHFTRERMAESTLGVYAELLQGRLRSPMRIEPFEHYTESQRARAFG